MHNTQINVHKTTTINQINFYPHEVVLNYLQDIQEELVCFVQAGHIIGVINIGRICIRKIKE